MSPQEILQQARKAIRTYAGEDDDKQFYVNRFVFARLQLDERKIKAQIKKDLFDTQRPCPHCNQGFESKSGIHLHRIDGSRGYSIGNCALMHPACHQEYHTAHPAKNTSATPDGAILKKLSKRYEGHAFLYWWDISPGFLTRIDRYNVVEFVKRDSDERCMVPIPALKGYLTQERQTTRHNGNWGIKVLKDREDELAFEPGIGDGRWLFLPVVWLEVL